MRKITMPASTKTFADDAMLSSKEVIAIFGYSCETSVIKLVEDGLIPKPDSDGFEIKKKNSFNSSFGAIDSRKELRWKVSTLRALADK